MAEDEVMLLIGYFVIFQFYYRFRIKRLCAEQDQQ